MAEWYDLDRAINDGSIESLSKARLEELSVVQPQASQNPAYHAKFQQAQLRISRALAKIAEAERKEEEEKRHSAIDRRLTELKKPHWTVRPNFWFTVIAASAAVVAAYCAWRSLQPSARPPPSEVPESPASSSQTQPPSPESPKP